MILPDNRDDRVRLYRNLWRECDVSRADRRAQNQRYRAWYLTGSDSTERARYNKIKQHVRFLSSCLFAPDSVRFGVVAGPEYGDRWVDECEVAGEDLHRTWHDSDAGQVASSAVKWAGVYPTTVVKLVMDGNEPVFELIDEPSDIGVRRESVTSWERQEVIAHFYDLDVHAYRRLVAAVPDPKLRATLDAEAGEHASLRQDNTSDTLPPTINRIILAQVSPTMTGVARGQPTGALALARETADVVRMCELWVWDDAITDYRVVTMFVPTERVLWDPPNPILPGSGEHPFFPLTLDPVTNYIWGLSPLEDLLLLQTWREQRMNDVDDMLQKQGDPPIVGEGVSGILEEKIKVLRKRGGIFTNPTPGAKVTPFIVPTPPDSFAEIDKIDGMFAKMGGLPLTVQGDGEPGVRSGDQEMARAALGAGPTRDMAMIVEAWLGQMATALWRVRRRVSTRELTKPDGTRFLLAQTPGDFVARVSAHSASPIYKQELLSKVGFAATQKWIDADEGIELLQLPQSEILRIKARRRMKAMGEMTQEQLELKKKDAEAKVIKAKAAAAKA